jgi:integrase/recombinase XerC
MGYADRTRKPPRTLTDEEQRRLLKASGEHRDGFRDHVMFSLALGCALRESEIVGLDVGDVSSNGLKVRRTVQLRVFKRAGGDSDPKHQRIHLPDGAFYKLGKYLRALYYDRTPDPETPLFLARGGARLSTRMLREIFGKWQLRAGFEHTYNFHALRHTAITNAYRGTKDIRIAQRVARHANLNTTTIYEHASDQQVADAVKGLPS